MKKHKTLFSILIVLLVFVIVMISSTLIFAVCERIFPCATLRFKKDLLFIGCEKDLSSLDTSNYSSVSLEELINDSKTTLNNNLILSTLYPNPLIFPVLRNIRTQMFSSIKMHTMIILTFRHIFRRNLKKSSMFQVHTEMKKNSKTFSMSLVLIPHKSPERVSINVDSP